MQNELAIKDGWIETETGYFRVPRLYYNKSTVPKKKFDAVKSTLLNKVGYYDFTNNQSTKAILFYSENLVIAV